MILLPSPKQITDSLLIGLFYIHETNTLLHVELLTVFWFCFLLLLSSGTVQITVIKSLLRNYCFNTNA